MEVHHHAHLASGETHTSRKKWTHYFWEFLMLFLAVFCGFLAEYQLEHKIEKEREKYYVKTLYEDIKVDTSRLQDIIKEARFVIPKIDTFRSLVHHNDIEKIPTGTWYYFGRFGTRNFQVSLQHATLQQLLSSGGLRYFRKQNVVYAIAGYEQALIKMRVNLESIQEEYMERVKARNQIFDAYYLDEIMELNVSNEKIDSFKRTTFPLLSNKKTDFVQYANLCQIRSFNQKFLQTTMEQALETAINLLALLKKEYYLSERSEWTLQRSPGGPSEK